MKSTTDAMYEHFTPHFATTSKTPKSIFHLLNINEYQSYLVSVYQWFLYDNLGGMLTQYSGIEQDQERVLSELKHAMKIQVKRLDGKYRQFVKDGKKSSKSIILNVTILILTFVGVIEGAPSIATGIMNHIKSCIEFSYVVFYL